MPFEIWLLGTPINNSLSPAMQNAALAALALDGRYLLHQADTAELASAIADFRRRPTIMGANLTIPLKQAVIPLLDALDPLAQRVGAVNTISRRGDQLIGFNTDVQGFSRAAEEGGYALDGSSVALIGAGGAARAVAEALRGRVASLTILARDQTRARNLIDELALDSAETVSFDRLAPSIQRADVIVNASPADLPPPDWQPRPGQRVFDLRSRRSLEGRAMLLHQGAASVEIWTGRKAPLEAMRNALARASEAVHA